MARTIWPAHLHARGINDEYARRSPIWPAHLHARSGPPLPCPYFVSPAAFTTARVQYPAVRTPYVVRYGYTRDRVHVVRHECLAGDVWQAFTTRLWCASGGPTTWPPHIAMCGNTCCVVVPTPHRNVQALMYKHCTKGVDVISPTSCQVKRKAGGVL